MMKNIKKWMPVVVVALALLVAGAFVRIPPMPDEIAVLTVPVSQVEEVRASAARCPGVVGVAVVGNELHVAYKTKHTSLTTIRQFLADAGLPTAEAGVLSPVEYRRKLGHYFRCETGASCSTECGHGCGDGAKH